MKTNIRPTVSIKKHLTDQLQNEKQTYGVISLGIAIKMVKDAGYRVYKRIENWEEI
jgi:hypothetical protein